MSPGASSPSPGSQSHSGPGGLGNPERLSLASSCACHQHPPLFFVYLFVWFCFSLFYTPSDLHSGQFPWASRKLKPRRRSKPSYPFSKGLNLLPSLGALLYPFAGICLPHLIRITPSSGNGSRFRWGIYLRLANEIYLAISLLPLFLSGQLNAQLSWASPKVPVAIPLLPKSWMFQPQQDGRGIAFLCSHHCSYLDDRLCFVPYCFVSDSDFLNNWMLTDTSREKKKKRKKKNLIFPLTKSGNRSVIIQQEDMSFLAFPSTPYPIGYGN